jgi:uridine kinase
MQKPVLVGIAGGSASGKSTLATALIQALTARDAARRVQLLATDHFCPGSRPGPTFVLSPPGEAMFDWNHPDAFDSDLFLAAVDQLLAEEPPPDVLLLEGLWVLHVPAIRERLDLRLFVELDADERALRRLLRNMRHASGNTDPRFIADYYLQSARVGHARYVEPSRVHADLILRGDGDVHRAAALVTAIIDHALPAGPTRP